MPLSRAYVSVISDGSAGAVVAVVAAADAAAGTVSSTAHAARDAMRDRRAVVPRLVDLATFSI
jgi:hypothetical protein